MPLLPYELFPSNYHQQDLQQASTGLSCMLSDELYCKVQSWDTPGSIIARKPGSIARKTHCPCIGVMLASPIVWVARTQAKNLVAMLHTSFPSWPLGPVGPLLPRSPWIPLAPLSPTSPGFPLSPYKHTPGLNVRPNSVQIIQSCWW